MAGKKGILPSHLTIKKFNHPNSVHPVVQLLEKVEDHRQPSYFFRYSLTSVLFMVLIGVMCGATDWPKIVVIAKGLKSWLSQYVDMSAGVPCERTFKNIMNGLHPAALEEILRKLANLIRKKSPSEVISFDGQTSRGTADKYKGLKGIHILNAWSSSNGLCIGQIKVDDKSNEITAIPELMKALDLKGTIISTDALNTQKLVAKRAIEGEANYLLPVKGNHRTLQEVVFSAFEAVEAEQKIARNQYEMAKAKAKEHRDKRRMKQLLEKGIPKCGTFFYECPVEKSHGRIEVRKCMTLSAEGLFLAAEWRGIQSLVRIDRERTIEGKTSHERVYYISSLKPNQTELIANSVREHWGVESLHWSLDVTFRQDKSRYRDRIGARNLAAMRKIIFNALAKEKSVKGGIATKQFAAAVDASYRDRILKNLF